MAPKLPLAILISGRGSNMQAIHASIQDGRLDAEIKLILSDQTKAPGIEYAKSKGLPHLVLAKGPGEKRAQFDHRVSQAIEAAGAKFIVLAGFMRILSKEFIQKYQGKIINIHPSLLPEFPGLNAQGQALAAGALESGCTVHFVDEGCDTGPIIAQRRVPVLPEDTEILLSERILIQEHQLYSRCLQGIAQGKIYLKDGKVVNLEHLDTEEKS